jgi:lysophospholipase L1-like esterase
LAARRPHPTLHATAADSVSYLALGDSYTIGLRVPAAERWPVQLAKLAQAQGLPLAAPHILAHAGWTTANLQAAIAERPDQRHDYGLVSLLIGVNNQYREQPLERYRTELRQLLASAVAFAGGRPGRVLVLSIPDWSLSEFAAGRDRARIAQELNEYNAAARQECQRAGVAFVDITPITRTAQPADFASDGLHYAGPQLRRWAEAALPSVQALLK